VAVFVAQIFGMPSQMPAEEELPGFKETMEEMSSNMFVLSRRILGLLARVLGAPSDAFDRHLTNPVATQRLLHYWPLRDYSTDIGVGEHTDYGLLTILKQDSVGGLQVLNAKDSKWVHCCPIDNAFVVNLGDMMGRWTGHRFKSTVHRVVNVSPSDRYSCAYFLEPNMDSLIVPGALAPSALGVPTWNGPGNCRPSQAAGATAEAILERFYRASGQLKANPEELGGPGGRRADAADSHCRTSFSTSLIRGS